MKFANPRPAKCNLANQNPQPEHLPAGPFQNWTVIPAKAGIHIPALYQPRPHETKPTHTPTRHSGVEPALSIAERAGIQKSMPRPSLPQQTPPSFHVILSIAKNLKFLPSPPPLTRRILGSIVNFIGGHSRNLPSFPRKRESISLPSTNLAPTKPTHTPTRHSGVEPAPSIAERAGIQKSMPRPSLPQQTPPSFHVILSIAKNLKFLPSPTPPYPRNFRPG